MRRVAEGLYRLDACGWVNTYLIEGTADMTLVDTGHSRGAERLCAELKENGFDIHDIGRVVVTHAHADHVGGLAVLLERHPMKVYAHPKELSVLTGIEPAGSFKGLKGFCRNFYFEQLLPWLPVSSALPVEAGTPLRGIPQWQILHTPGHTAGSLSLFHPVRQILICGDILVNREGRLQASEACFSSDPQTVRKTIEELSELDCDILCPGHGDVLRGGAFRYIEAVLSRTRGD